MARAYSCDICGIFFKEKKDITGTIIARQKLQIAKVFITDNNDMIDNQDYPPEKELCPTCQVNFLTDAVKRLANNNNIKIDLEALK
jgi:hypothetical protein